VEYPGGVLIGNRNNSPVADFITYDFSDFEILYAEIESSAFGAGAAAGLHLILGIEVGIRDGGYYTWFTDDSFSDFTLLNLDFSESLENSIPLIEISASNPEFELELTEGVTLVGRVPTGADTENSSNDNSSSISAFGRSETKFLALEADLDALLVRFLSKVSVAGPIIKGLGETIFAEHKFDLGDYVSFIGKKKVVFSATALDIGAEAGLVLTENVELDIGGNDGVADVRVTVTHDNGTPGNTLDDETGIGVLGGTVVLPEPIAGPDPRGTNVDIIGDITTIVQYSLLNPAFEHKIGLAISAAFTIEALQAELGGSWIPSWLQFSFGPLFSAELPDGGINLDLGTLFTNDFNISPSAFNTVTETYSTFFTDTLAPTQTEADLENPNAREIIFAYREAQIANAADSAATFGDLWNNDPGQNEAIIAAGTNNVTAAPGTLPANAATTPFTWTWDGTIDAISNTITAGSQNFIIINPIDNTGVLPLQDIEANVRTVNLFDTTTLFASNVGHDLTLAQSESLLDVMNTNQARGLETHYGANQHVSLIPVMIEGNAGDDLLVMYDDSQNL